MDLPDVMLLAALTGIAVTAGLSVWRDYKWKKKREQENIMRLLQGKKPRRYVRR